MEAMTVETVRAAIAQSSEMGNFWLSLSMAWASVVSSLAVMGMVGALAIGGRMLVYPVVTHWYSRFATAVVTLGVAAGCGAVLLAYLVMPVVDSQRAVAQVILEADAYLRVAEPLSPTLGNVIIARERVSAALRDAEAMRRHLALLNNEKLAVAEPTEKLDLAQLVLLQKLAAVN